jgi:hypothetical protein
MWRRRTSKRIEESPAVEAARREVERAKADREKVRRQWSTVNRIVGEVQDEVERNHFAESIQIAFQRRAHT